MLKAATGAGGGGWCPEQGARGHKSFGRVSDIFCSLMTWAFAVRLRGPVLPSLSYNDILTRFSACYV